MTEAEFRDILGEIDRDQREGRLSADEAQSERDAVIKSFLGAQAA